MPRRDGEVFLFGTAMGELLETTAYSARVGGNSLGSRAYRGWLAITLGGSANPHAGVVGARGTRHVGVGELADAGPRLPRAAPDRVRQHRGHQAGLRRRQIARR